ncbi:MAG: hypothetical protein R3C71_14110 [Candidatus Krumholzibacteriia bacterium]|nr:hypothetical protein [bacterium]MCB9513986.1 hypothetical protein [Candidatus Latescibacterota bacterium]MCB9517016.1 hypothetical protein [Candidatus Latescibacterota bacterium]
MFKSLTLAALLALLAAPAFADDPPTVFWNDGEPEVSLGVYFDAAGRDSVWEGEVPDTLTVYLMMWNGSRRNEGGIRALEYMVELPSGLMLIHDALPDYSNLAMGRVLTGFTQAVQDKIGDGLLINTLTLLRTSDIAYDARIRILPHPDSGYLRYVHGKGGPRNVDMHMLEARDGLLNPKLAATTFKPIRSH